MKTENVKKSGRTSRTKHIGLVRNDSYLEPFEEAIKGRRPRPRHTDFDLLGDNFD